MPSHAANPVQVVLDAADPGALAQFWATALGYVVQPPPEGFDSWPAFLGSIGVPESAWNSRSAVVDPRGVGPRLFFQQVPEAKTVKNRVHVDVNAVVAESGADAFEVTPEERLAAVGRWVDVVVAAGAEHVETVDEMGEHWVVLRDPEGNEFCVH
jgi:Glyoxalase-like domain